MGNRIIDLRDPDDYIPFDEYDAFEEAYKMRLQAKANELQRYVDDTLAEKSPISVRYKETKRLGVVQPHILVNNNGQFYFFTMQINDLWHYRWFYCTFLCLMEYF